MCQATGRKDDHAKQNVGPSREQRIYNIYLVKVFAVQVVYSRGPLLWQGFTLAGNALSKRRIGRSRNKVTYLLLFQNTNMLPGCTVGRLLH